MCPRVRVVQAALLFVAAILADGESHAEPWVNIGPWGGPVLRVVPDPTDGSSLFAATFPAGVFKSTNGGLSWVPSRSGFGIFEGGVTGTQGIAVDPLSPHVIYAASASNGIYKSVDGGSSWRHLSTAPFSKDLVWNVACDPTLEGTVYAGTLSSSPYVSRDGGEMWFPPQIEGGDSVPDFLRFAADPRRPGVVFAAGGVNGVYVTSDHGATWRQQMAGMLQKEDVRDVAISPLDPNVVFALVQSKNTLYRSVDGGRTWMIRQRVSRNLRQSVMEVFVQGPEGPAPGALAILIGRRNGFIISYDEGLTWQEANGGLTLQYYPELRPSDLAWHPAQPSVILAATERGLYRSEDGGRNWQLSQYGITNLEAFDVAMDPSNPDWACILTDYFISSEGKIQTTSDGGVSWQLQTSGLGLRRFVGMAQHLSRPQTLYVAAYDIPRLPRVYRSDDFGRTWYPVFVASRGRTRVQFVQVSPSDPDTVFVGGRPSLYRAKGNGINVIYRTIDGGISWRRLARIPDPLTTMAIDPKDQSVLYVGSAYGTLYKSTDGGLTWTSKSTEPWSHESVNTIAIDPQQTNVVYAGTCRGIYKSTDGGATWRGINDGLIGIYGVLCITVIAVDPAASNIVYVGVDSPMPLYKSTDRGEHWKTVSEGLHSSTINALVINPVNPNIIYAATSSSGLFLTLTGGE